MHLPARLESNIANNVIAVAVGEHSTREIVWHPTDRFRFSLPPTQIFEIALSSFTDQLFDFSSLTPFVTSIFGNGAEIENGMKEIQMIYYERSSEEDIFSHNFPLAQSQEIMKYIDVHKPYVLYIHGYQEVPSNESVQTVVSAYIQRGSDNIIVLDWSAFAFGNYINVAAQTSDVAVYVAKSLEYLTTAGLNTDTLHIIGHSLGAQIAGFIGRYLNFTIPRVTGLDPAYPLFYQFGADHINKSSAHQVDVIHTDGGQYGALRATGSVDFYANGGIKIQPGCPNFGLPMTPRSLCSHWRSWRYYAESVISNTSFPAINCSSYKNFLEGECDSNDIAYFGYSMPRNISGKYYFSTNSKSPYGRGLTGVKKDGSINFFKLL